MVFYDIKSKKDLVNLKKKIQKRNRDEKIDDSNIYHEVDKFYKPLTEPLKAIAESSKASQSSLESNKHTDNNHSNIPALEYQPKNILAIEPEHSSLLSLGNISGKYLKKGLSNVYDYAYGLKPIDNSTHFKLGRNEVRIDGDNLTVVNGSTYEGTEGLWKLLTLKDPGPVTVNDKEKYEKLITETKAFYRDDEDRVKANKGNKYKNIIQPIFKKFMSKAAQDAVTPIRNIRDRSSSFSGVPETANVTGMGIKFLPSDPNKLLERHRLLTLEMIAGNTNVFNEIQAINDVLLESKIFNTTDIENYSIKFFS